MSEEKFDKFNLIRETYNLALDDVLKIIDENKKFPKSSTGEIFILMLVKSKIEGLRK